ncbi:MAG: hypothetical protein V1807_03130 [Patescibacteria group bacterium]
MRSSEIIDSPGESARPILVLCRYQRVHSIVLLKAAQPGGFLIMRITSFKKKERNGDVSVLSYHTGQERAQVVAHQATL